MIRIICFISISMVVLATLVSMNSALNLGDKIDSIGDKAGDVGDKVGDGLDSAKDAVPKPESVIPGLSEMEWLNSIRNFFKKVGDYFSKITG